MQRCVTSILLLNPLGLRSDFSRMHRDEGRGYIQRFAERRIVLVSDHSRWQRYQ